MLVLCSGLSLLCLCHDCSSGKACCRSSFDQSLSPQLPLMSRLFTLEQLMPVKQFCFLTERKGVFKIYFPEYRVELSNFI